MSRPLAELTEAYVHLKRAQELAQFFQHSPEWLELIDKLRRGTAKAIQMGTQAKPTAAGD
jgi:hypothetical protein